MAELAADDDPRVRSAGMTGAQYFLGRIDAHAQGFDPDASGDDVADQEREALLSQCSTLMGSGGRDFRAIGDRLARDSDQTV